MTASSTSDELVPYLQAHMNSAPGCSEDGGASVDVADVSYLAELLQAIKAELKLPFEVKLMYPDADFGEMCLATTLGELPSDVVAGAKLKAFEP
eukprot:SAG22_NODE_1797_length_3550_cov_2.119386_3_plen_94_part_00